MVNDSFCADVLHGTTQHQPSQFFSQQQTQPQPQQQFNSIGAVDGGGGLSRQEVVAKQQWILDQAQINNQLQQTNGNTFYFAIKSSSTNC